MREFYSSRRRNKINSRSSTKLSRSSRRRIKVFLHVLSLPTLFILGSLTSAASAATWSQEFLSRDRHWAVTDEKFEIAMQRVRRGTPRIRIPVLLIHGMIVNGRFLDLGQGASLAEYLAEAGFDVWNVSLRGTGRSLNPLGWGDKPWTLDAIVKQDLPAVIDYVKRETKSDAVFLLGYELGGILAYAYLGTNAAHSAAALVSIGAPMTFDAPEQEPLKLLLKLDAYPALKNFLLYVSVPMLGQLALPLFKNVEEVFYNPDNLDQALKQELLAHALAPVNRGVLDHVITMIDKGEAVSADGKVSYREALANVGVPLLIIGGGEDPIAPAPALEKIYREVGSTDRELMIFWSDPEEDVSYGHFDLILGRNAAEEVFPLIRDWLTLQADR